MSVKEAKRVYVMEQVVAGMITVRQAAKLLRLSERQVKRLKGGMKKEGLAALLHKNRGRKPKHAISDDIRQKVTSLATSEYRGASCQHMSELFEQYQGINISSRSIRRLLAQAGILNPHSRKAPRRRRCRDRMPQEGLLVQCDASPFDWLEDRGPRLNLHGAIDDATGKVLGLFFRLQEDLHGYLQVLKQVVSKHGVPNSIYSDRHTIFFSPKKDKLSIEDELAGKHAPLSQLGHALKLLSITHIPALSPQAKGRVERLWGTLQHRLSIELRLGGVSDIDQANAFLPSFIDRFNERFAVEPKHTQSAFRPAPRPAELNLILASRTNRKASNGSLISYHGQTYHLADEHGNIALLKPRSTVDVLSHLDGPISALYDNKSYRLQPFTKPSPISKQPNMAHPPKTQPKPPLDHPWRIPCIKPRPNYYSFQEDLIDKHQLWSRLFLET